LDFDDLVEFSFFDFDLLGASFDFFFLKGDVGGDFEFFFLLNTFLGTSSPLFLLQKAQTHKFLQNKHIQSSLLILL